MTSALTADADDPNDWKVVVKALAVEVVPVVAHAVGLHVEIVCEEAEVETPNSEVPATMVPPAVSAKVCTPLVIVPEYFTKETYPAAAFVVTVLVTAAWLT